jgi:hypothetical protein
MPGSDRPEAHGFRCSFTPLKRGTFHHSLTVLVPYRSPVVFSLGWWSTPLPTSYHVAGGTHVSPARAPAPRRLRGSHPFQRPVPAAFGCRAKLCAREEAAASSPDCVQPRNGSAGRLLSPPRFGLLPVRSPLLGESFLLLGVLRCFSSPGALLRLPQGAGV